VSQNDFVITNQTAPNFRADLNLALQALASNSSGASAPATTYANMLWYDTSSNILKMRNEADDAWIDLGTLDQSGNTFTPFGLVAESADPNFTVDPTLLATRATIKTFVDTEIATIPTTVPTTTQVLNATAGATHGEVGVYSFLFNAIQGQSITAGTNYAGSNLRYTGIRATTNLISNTAGVNVVSSGASTSPTTPTGTWKAMSNAANITEYFAATLFLRIS